MHNPYQKAIVHLIMSTNKLLVESLGSGGGGGSDDGGEFLKVHAFGFGDSITKDTGVFSVFDPVLTMRENNSQSNNISDTILSSYTNAVKRIDLSGPSSFAPVIRQTVEIIKKSTNSATMSILFLLTDGELSSDDGSSMFETMQAIVDASCYALSIVIVGVGDGPWTHILRLDKYLCNKCKFDNLNFVDYSQFMTTAANSRGANAKCLDNELFCLKLFNKLPSQFRNLRQLNLI